MHENTCGKVTFLVNLMFRRLDKVDGPIFREVGIYSVYSKNKALRKEIPSKDLAVQRQPFPDFYKKGLLRIS